MNRVKILICDDDEGIRLVIPRMLSELGVTVLTAATFSEAVSIMAETPTPDFIFLDLGLPDTPGKMQTLESLKDLRIFNPEAPVVVLTGDQSEKLEQVARTLGVDAYLRKNDMDGQRDLWLAMKEAINVHVSRGFTATEAMTKILNAISTKMEEHQIA